MNERTTLFTYAQQVKSIMLLVWLAARRMSDKWHSNLGRNNCFFFLFLSCALCYAIQMRECDSNQRAFFNSQQFDCASAGFIALHISATINSFSDRVCAHTFVDYTDYTLPDTLRRNSNLLEFLNHSNNRWQTSNTIRGDDSLGAY